MTPNQARDALWRDLGFRRDKEDVLFFELNEAQRRVEDDPKIELPWFLLEEYTGWSTTVGSRNLALPSGFLRLHEGLAPEYYDATEAEWVEMGVEEESFLRANYTGSGAPVALAITGLLAKVYYLPDAVYSIRAHLYRRGATIVKDAAETPWLSEAPDLLIGEAGMVIASALRDNTAASNSNRRRAEGMKRLMSRINDRELQGRKLQMGGSD